ncbi:hypothetical protein [Coleofasciculus sp. H7-2]|uniref:hypothetical protein n=1 Tax=Coleofasciculus sp. H7-2 TaxID=3351545 RepID=UPI0036734B62
MRDETQHLSALVWLWERAIAPTKETAIALNFFTWEQIANTAMIVLRERSHFMLDSSDRPFNQ